ncbi:MAG: pilus assembly protein N-terminal domain-containing protein [Gemmataceae bacterium]|nr:pilus assembly protein N-terminal domain-containing protein [Gemmataceae bacterium]MDW8263983.1 pilus assembly protein N-terminal domain-containing protein [Gemmataceae bacterium]
MAALVWGLGLVPVPLWAQAPMPNQPVEIAPAPRPLPASESACPAGAGPTTSTPDGRADLPRPDPEKVKKYRQFLETTVDPEAILDLIVGRPRLLIFKQAPKRVQIEVNERAPVASYTVITEREISVVGRSVGTTVLNLWFADPADPTKDRILSYLVRVFPDPQARERFREQLIRFYKELEAEINRTYCDSSVCINLVGDNVVVSGQARDIAEAEQIINIVRSSSYRAPEDPTEPARPEESAAPEAAGPSLPLPPTPTGVTVTTNQLGLAQSVSQTVTRPAAVRGRPTRNVINQLRVPGEQQVLLKVTVAEVNRAAARSIGINFTVSNNQGLPVFSNTTGNLSPFGALGGGFAGGVGAGGAGGFGGGFGGGAGFLFRGINLPTILDNGQIFLAINALRNLNLARSLAEPNLVTLNGQTASFQAGGQFPVPIVTGFTAAGLQGVSFVPFGVQLNFTPYVTDKDRIRLVVAATVSTRDNAASANVAGTIVPSLNTRTFETTVELREGQTLAVAGLIQNNFGADATRVPFVGDLPIIGRMGAFDRSSAGEQELVIIITPELVRPLEAKERPRLPGADVFEPSDLEFYLLGRLESRRMEDYRSVVRTDLQRMARYRRCEDIYILGPHGHTDGRR